MLLGAGVRGAGCRQSPAQGWCSACLLFVVSGNTVPFFNMTFVYVPEDLELGEWGSLGEAPGCRRSGPGSSGRG